MGTILSITGKIDNGAGGVGRRMPTEITVRGRSGASEPPERGTVHATGSAHIEVEFRDFTALSWWVTAHTEGVRISDVEWSLSIRRGRRLRNAECRPFAGWRPRSTHTVCCRLSRRPTVTSHHMAELKNRLRADLTSA